MTMLKTYRKRRKRQRTYVTFGLLYDPATSTFVATIDGKIVRSANCRSCYPFDTHYESFNVTVMK